MEYKCQFCNFDCYTPHEYTAHNRMCEARKKHNKKERHKRNRNKYKLQNPVMQVTPCSEWDNVQPTTNFKETKIDDSNYIPGYGWNTSKLKMDDLLQIKKDFV